MDKPLLTAIPEVEVRQVFLNLILNSLDALDNGGQIRITAKYDHGKIIVEVTDSGKGIQQDQLQKIFQPFFTTKPTGQGTGLGLSISYDIIVQEHKGELNVESKEGEFTEFIISLPR